MKQILKFEVELDENHLPVNMKMDTSDGSGSEYDIKALMISAWAARNKETLRIYLWTSHIH